MCVQAQYIIPAIIRVYNDSLYNNVVNIFQSSFRATAYKYKNNGYTDSTATTGLTRVFLLFFYIVSCAADFRSCCKSSGCCFFFFQILRIFTFFFHHFGSLERRRENSLSQKWHNTDSAVGQWEGGTLRWTLYRYHRPLSIIGACSFLDARRQFFFSAAAQGRSLGEVKYAWWRGQGRDTMLFGIRILRTHRSTRTQHIIRMIYAPLIQDVLRWVVNLK